MTEYTCRCLGLVQDAIFPHISLGVPLKQKAETSSKCLFPLLVAETTRSLIKVTGLTQ